jgi:hypothetical protein
MAQEDVLELVNLSEDMRRARRQRAREYEERDHFSYERRHRSHRSVPWDKVDDERIVEREIVYDSAPRYNYR